MMCLLQERVIVIFLTAQIIDILPYAYGIINSRFGLFFQLVVFLLFLFVNRMRTSGLILEIAGGFNGLWLRKINLKWYKIFEIVK